MDSIGQKKTEASFLSQMFIGLIDVVCVLVIAICLMKYQLLPLQILNVINPTLLVVICFIIHRMALFLFFSRSLGMRIFGVCLLNSELRPLSFAEKLLASVFILYKGVDYYND